MLLSHSELAALADRNVIMIDDYDQINAASIDLTLGKTVMVETAPPPDYIVDLRARTPLQMDKVTLDDRAGIILAPGQFILAATVEVFNLPNDISGEFKLKSSCARIGIEHLNAGWCDAGWSGSVLTLEIKNLTQFHPIRLRPGDKIGQIVFFRHMPVPDRASYAQRGRYNGHKDVSGIVE